MPRPVLRSFGAVFPTVVLVASLPWSSTARAADDTTGSKLPTSVSFGVDVGKAGAPWTLHVTNTGTAPVFVLADARLVRLELQPAAPKSKASQCILPSDALPSPVDERELVLPPGKTYSQKFDPAFHCFDAKNAAVWVAGTTVTAKFGFPPRVSARTAKKPVAETAPFVVRAVPGTVDTIPVKELVATPVTLTEVDLPSAKEAPKSSKVLPLEASLPSRLDVSVGKYVATSVTIANVDSSSVSFLARPSTVAVDVSPRGGRTTRCALPGSAGRIPELYASLAPKAKTQVAVQLEELCPPHTFDEAGVYEVVPRVDSSATESADVVPRALRGVSASGPPMLLRVRGTLGDATPKRPTYD
ncbi:MAG: hypothetical protein U0169_09190 [Polyangiaceae bacterium]